jgi:nitrate reductase gamma subunit
MNSDFLFAVWPYFATGLFCFGLVFRFLLQRKRIATVKAKLVESSAVFAGSRLWRISLLLLLFGHVAGLAFPRQILLWNGSVVRLYVLEGFAFAIGALALAGWATLVWRYLKRSDVSIVVDVADTAFLGTLFAALLSGLLMAAWYRWGSIWGVITLRPYVVSLLRGAPAPNFAIQMPFLVRLHVFSSFAAIALVPFTRLAPFLMVAFDWSLSLPSKPASAVVRAGAAWLERYNPGAWIWPEED